MATTKADLQAEIKEMEAVYNNADTPQNVKDLLKEPLANARKILADMEKKPAEKKPAPVQEKKTKAAVQTAKKVVTKAKKAVKQKPGSAGHEKTLKELVAGNKKLQEIYAGYSEEELQADAKRKATAPGSRVSASGKIYREYRPNRTDVGSGKDRVYLADGGTIDEPYPNFPLLIDDATSTTLDEFMDAYEETMDPAEMDRVKLLQPGEQVYIGVHAGYAKIERPKTMAKGGAMNEDKSWHIVGLNRPPANFTPEAIASFTQAFEALEAEKSDDNENGYYKNACAAMASLVQIITELLSLHNTNNSEATRAHALLQEVGIYNYKTGLLLDTTWLNKELDKRILAKGGKIDNSTVEKLAKEFSRILRRDLKPSEINAIIAENNQPGNEDTDASHDYLDANMTMDEAFINVMGRRYVFFNDDEPETEAQNDADTDLENKAWTMAKKHNYYAGHKLTYPRKKEKITVQGTVNKNHNKTFSELGEAIHYAEITAMKTKQDFTITVNGKKIGSSDKDGNFNSHFAKGGDLNRNFSRDRKFKSQQPHEQQYKRKIRPKNPVYKVHAKGGAVRNFSRDRKFKSQEPHEQKYKRKVTPKNPAYKTKKLARRILKKK